MRQFEFGAESPRCQLELQYEVPLQQTIAAAGSTLLAVVAPSLAAV